MLDPISWAKKLLPAPQARPRPAPEEMSVHDQVVWTATDLARGRPPESALLNEPQPVKIPDPGPSTQPADPFRQQAREVLKTLHSELKETAWGSYFVEQPAPETVELTALNLFEQSLGSRSLPDKVFDTRPNVHSADAVCRASNPPVSPQARGLSQIGAYTAILAATAAVGLSAPAICGILEDFSPELLSKGVGGFTPLLAATTATDTMEHRHGKYVIGARTELENQNVDIVLQELRRRCPKADESFDSLVISNYLRSSPEGGDPGGAASLDGHMSLLVQRGVTHDLDALRWVVFHEVGHSLDRLGIYSGRPDSPFGKGPFITQYARDPGPGASGLPQETLGRIEDFAETNSAVLFHWDRYKACPDLLYACGDKVAADKQAWILDKVYDQPLPPPSERLKKFLGATEITDEQGKVLYSSVSRDVLEHCVERFLFTYTPGQPWQPPADMPAGDAAILAFIHRSLVA